MQIFFSYIKIYKLHSTTVYVSAAARDTSPEIPDITILQTRCTKSSLSGLDPVQSLLYGVYLYCHDITETPLLQQNTIMLESTIVCFYFNQLTLHEKPHY